ncbi:hypothetical protein BO86DRAFT_447975 [Aspergillus japonicus CBS 114.51]|uniref:G-patch domain-containing protein n=1 Tax=Aspergillus japonicus CBS 114.51 TaxID=1448312 RepID=A0A8T8X2X2_ASPJA|nr:hypothetical protein BO86DRAFT_447975 [Aspergillus japonicus CBS 114.51]RAH82270.1 hypothetical protein BO86DRAFT_447975 [Aspergillus japonicus CBS 114.51]
MSTMPADPAEEEEDYFLPLEDQRVFGAGIRRKRVPFVRSSDPDLHTTDSALRRNAAPSTETTTGATIANKYLSIVLSKSATPTPAPALTPEFTPDSTATSTTTNTSRARAASPQSAAPPSTSTPTPTPTLPPPPPSPRQDNNLNLKPNSNPNSQICEICNLPLTASSSSSSSQTKTPTAESSTRPHEASLAHQLCLTHSHPPSHLDRTRPGLRYLAAYGWDPDSRLGLGAPGREGIRAPVKGKLKVDTVGLRVTGHNADDEDAPTKRKRVVGGQEQAGGRGSGSAKIQKLNAKEVRRGQVDARKRGERLRELFYRDERVLRYLGEG